MYVRMYIYIYFKIKKKKFFSNFFKFFFFLARNKRTTRQTKSKRIGKLLNQYIIMQATQSKVLAGLQQLETTLAGLTSSQKFAPTCRRRFLFLIRHGHAQNNLEKFHHSAEPALQPVTGAPKTTLKTVHLTGLGKQQVQEASSLLLSYPSFQQKPQEQIRTTFFCSPLTRAVETAEILALALSSSMKKPLSEESKRDDGQSSVPETDSPTPESEIVLDPRLSEIGAGTKEGCRYSNETLQGIWDHSRAWEYDGESYDELLLRVLCFLKDLCIRSDHSPVSKNSDKDPGNAVVVSHGTPLCMLLFVLAGMEPQNNGTQALLKPDRLTLQPFKMNNAEVRAKPLPSLQDIHLYVKAVLVLYENTEAESL